MNILFINSMKEDEFGGGEKWMITAAHELSERGHNVYLGSKPESRLLEEAARFAIPTMMIDIRSDFNPFKSIKISRLLERYKIDVVICNFNKDVRVAGLAARLAKTKPLVVARHGVLLSRKKLKHRLTLTLLADAIITNTKDIQRTYYSYGWFKNDFIEVIYNGLDVSRLNASPKKHHFPEKYAGKKIIFSAGRLTSQKGFEYLIRAAAVLIKKRKNLLFLIAGEGPLAGELGELIRQNGLEDHVELIGYQKDITPYIRSSQLVALSSIHEGMPNILMEAMALGKAAVATAVNGVPELVVHQQTGLIVPPGDADALAKAIDQIIDEPELLEYFGNTGQKRIQQHFDIKRMTDHLETFLTETLKDHRDPSSKRRLLKRLSKKLIISSMKLLSANPAPQTSFTGELKSLLILAQERYGDIILLTPLINGLRQAYPDLEIVVVGVTDLIHILKNEPHIDGLYNIKNLSLEKRNQLFRRRFDLLFNTKDHPSVTMLYLTQKFRAGFKVGIYHPHHVGYFNHMLILREKMLRASKNYALLEFLGRSGWKDGIRPTITLGNISNDILRFMSKVPMKRVIGINLSTSQSERNVPLERWSQLIEKLAHPIIIFAMPEHYAQKEVLEKKYSHVIPSPPTKSIFEAAYMVQHLKLLISPDTALIHIASCFNVPVVGLYLLEIESIRFAPLSDHSSVFLADNGRMDSITTERVYKAVNRVISGTQSAN